jgi:alpha-L-arabinofuranosidase
MRFSSCITTLNSHSMIVTMKKLRILIPCFILAGLISGTLLSQEPAVIKIDIDRKIGDIDPNIYGGFLEPIFTTVYGSLYDPSSPFADENGFRKDYMEQIRELKIPVVRWPGGNYVSGYNWEDGIGPKEQRPARLDLAWNQIERNQMGTDEYVKFCELVGAENFICINAGTGTLDDARHWVEYCNYEKGTYYSDLRRKYGHEEPYHVKYWALGNETDGPWQMGQKNVVDYVKFAKEAAKLIRLVDQDVKLIASGASNYRPEDNSWIDWNDYVLQEMVGSIDYISVHRYVHEALKSDKSYSSMVSLNLDLDQKIELVEALILKAMMKSESERPVYISFDEWGSRVSGLLAPLMISLHLNSFIRHADVVKMANLTMLSSLVGNSPDGDFKNSLFQAFYLYTNNCHGTSLDVDTKCETYSNEIFNDIPFLDVSAAFNEQTDMLVVNVVNRHETKAVDTDIVLQTGDFTGNARTHEVNGKTIEATNTKTEQGVRIVTKDIKFKGNTIRYSFPAHSLTQIEIPVKEL